MQESRADVDAPGVQQWISDGCEWKGGGHELCKTSPTGMPYTPEFLHGHCKPSLVMLQRFM